MNRSLKISYVAHDKFSRSKASDANIDIIGNYEKPRVQHSAQGREFTFNVIGSFTFASIRQTVAFKPSKTAVHVILLDNRFSLIAQYIL